MIGNSAIRSAALLRRGHGRHIYETVRTKALFSGRATVNRGKFKEQDMSSGAGGTWHDDSITFLENKLKQNGKARQTMIECL